MSKLTLLCFLLIGPFCVWAQADSTIIRDQEEQMRKATMIGDTTTFFKYWAPELVVNTPVNRVATLEMVKMFTRAGEISYSSFELDIEKITIVENVAMSMGKEVVKPKDNTNHPGQTVTRRYTDIWLKRKGEWRMIGRQSTEVSVK